MNCRRVSDDFPTSAADYRDGSVSAAIYARITAATQVWFLFGCEGRGWLARLGRGVVKGGLVLGWVLVAEGVVQASLAVPGHPSGGGHLDVVDAAPRFALIGQFVFVGGVDRLGEDVVSTLTTRADRGCDPSSASRSV